MTHKREIVYLSHGKRMASDRYRAKKKSQNSSSKMGKNKYWRSKLVGKPVQKPAFYDGGWTGGFKRELALHIYIPTVAWRTFAIIKQ